MRRRSETVDAEFQIVQPRRIRWGVAIWSTLTAACGGYFIYEQTGDGASAGVAFMLVFQWPLMGLFADLGEKVTQEEADWLAARLARSSRGRSAAPPSNPESVSFLRDLTERDRERR